eukprot:TRINITY_DN35147_c0_g1_i1.p1 TRINITY_DN35147_c0_g1~~TRINITY_DN35147_c0_g1_i1.p1  ORF type:complete len:190 (+),score=45.91 TRINITY_DN35147_c0_g1_i1:151-720(+)
MTATSSFPNIFLPKVSITSSTEPFNSPPRSFENYGPNGGRRRSRCISCSDSSFGSSFEESSSFLLESTLLPRRIRTDSVSERIKGEIQCGTVTYFCKSRGHGYIQPSQNSGEEHFVHVSDVESDVVPLNGDQVSYRLCPIPPKFEKCQAVNVTITKMSDQSHKRWDTPETPEDIPTEEDLSNHPPPADV